MTTTTAQKALEAAARAAELAEQLGRANDEIDSLLHAAIRAWADIEPPGCGFMGGWQFDELRDGVVHLKHECFYAHGYDLREEHSVTVPLEELLAGKRRGAKRRPVT